MERKMTVFGMMMVCVCCLPIWAQDIEPTVPVTEQPQPQSVFKLGVGSVTTWKPYRGVDDESFAFPLVFYHNQKLTVFGTVATYSFFGEENQWALQGLARLRAEGYEEDDSSYLNGMDDRDPTLELGLRWMQNLDFAVMTMDFTHDVLDEHRGYEFKLTLRKPFRNVFDIESLNVTPMAGVNWRSKQLNNYYYGVDSSEATLWRPAYDAGGSVGCLTGVQCDYQLTKKLSMIGLLNVEWHGSEITDSPIVDEDYSVVALIGAMYEF